MILVNVERQFWSLVQTANDLDAEAHRRLMDDSCEGVDANRMLEPTLVAICSLVLDHPDKRQTFVACFSDLVLGNRKSPWVLVPFCMRMLRMTEIEEVLQREMDRTKGTGRYANLMNYCSAVMHAFHDDVWEEADSFR